MSLDAMKQALALICSARLCEVNSMSSRQEMLRLMIEAIDTLRAVIEEAEKPWVKTYTGGTPHYTTPDEQPRQWQGLTDEERNECVEWVIALDGTTFSASLAKAIEAKLKEKNT